MSSVMIFLLDKLTKTAVRETFIVYLYFLNQEFTFGLHEKIK